MINNNSDKDEEEVERVKTVIYCPNNECAQSCWEDAGKYENDILKPSTKPIFENAHPLFCHFPADLV